MMSTIMGVLDLILIKMNWMALTFLKKCSWSFYIIWLNQVHFGILVCGVVDLFMENQPIPFYVKQVQNEEGYMSLTTIS